MAAPRARLLALLFAGRGAAGPGGWGECFGSEAEFRDCCCPREPSSCPAEPALEQCCGRLAHRCEAGSSEGRAAEGTTTTTTTERWFCSHTMPWEECKEYLPSERRAVREFLTALEDSNEPPPGAFQGRGIVMSGGPSQLLQALANLHILRTVLKSDLPVEFWHAFELHDAHCEQLATYGAVCRNLQSPGAYPLWQTTTPAILSSSFREVLWLDTDVTLLVQPERLFETEAFRREGALFWPDLWGTECSIWGQTSWGGHIAWHLLDMPFNKSDPQCIHEHEAGHLLIDKERHWKPLCLANFLATRNFFTKVIWGYKDVFRLAWVKLRASNWYCPVRPGLVGAVIHKKTFQAISLMHFWPSGDEMGTGPAGRPVPLYIHQKKIPFQLWQDVATFDRALGQCVNYHLQPIVPEKHGAELWKIQETDPDLATTMSDLDFLWNEVYTRVKASLEQDPRESQRDLARLHPKRDRQNNVEFMQVTKSCKCDYLDNRWFLLLTFATGMGALPWPDCSPVQGPELDAFACPVGHLLLSLLCAKRLGAGAGEAAGHVARLLPEVSDCLAESFWPLELPELERFAREVPPATPGSVPALPWRGSRAEARLASFPAGHRRCMPMRDPSCWSYMANDDNAVREAGSCFHCCNRAQRKEWWHQECFNDVFTEERCCNPA